MINLFDKYGFCIVPKGTLLFRSDTCFNEKEIFFGTTITTGVDYNRGYTKNHINSKVQVWHVLKDVKLLSLLLEIKCNSNGATAIPEVFRFLFNEEHEQHEIRATYPRLRNKLSQELSKLNYDGWFTSINGSYNYEFCFFSTEFVMLQEKILPNSTILKTYDAIDFIQIELSEEVIKNTKSIVQKGIYNNKKNYPHSRQNKLLLKLNLY